MTSNINPNNIDGTYPVAGQDNNSQGFRDNFTNTKTNFQYAADEITDLQTKAVLKSALTGTTLDNDMGGQLLYNYQSQQMYLTGSEDLDNGAAANLSLTTSYFSTSGAETATLANGQTGQIKVFAMYADGGDMVITVATPGWGGAGTITFSSAGDSCILMFIASKWFCIGNNGCTFA